MPETMNQQEKAIAAAIMHAVDGMELPPVLSGMERWVIAIDWDGAILGESPKDGDLVLSGPGARTVGIHFDVKITQDDKPELPIP